MSTSSCEPLLRLALPKGRMQHAVTALLADAAIEVRATARDYRPALSLGSFETKVLKPQNIVEMLAAGTRDLGFAGADWIAEKQAPVVEVLDTGLDPVDIVVAAPPALAPELATQTRRLRVASEYELLARRWIAERDLDAEWVRSYGATEVFPPEDADLIIDNRATGSTLAANGLDVVEVLSSSSTRLYASTAAWVDAARRERIEHLRLLLESVLEARRRVMLEVNAPADRLAALVELLPSMREATVAPLFGDGGYAIKAAVPRSALALLVPRIKQAGGSDIAVTALEQIVP